MGTLEKTSGKEVTFRFKNRQRKEKGFKKIKDGVSTRSDAVCVSLLAKGDTAASVMMGIGNQNFTIIVFPKSNTIFWNNALEMIASN